MDRVGFAAFVAVFARDCFAGLGSLASSVARDQKRQPFAAIPFMTVDAAAEGLVYSRPSARRKRSLPSSPSTTSAVCCCLR